MSLVMVGIGTAVPEHRIAQSDAAGLAISFANAAPGRERALAAVYRQSGIRTRGSVLLEATIDEPFVQRFFPPAEAGGDRPSTGARMKRYAEKPSERRRRKEKVMAFTCMLRRRYAE